MHDKCCEWYAADVAGGRIYDTSCGHRHEFEFCKSLEDSDYVLCPYCGGMIVGCLEDDPEDDDCDD